MGRYDREIGLELAEDLRDAGFDVELAESRLLEKVTAREKVEHMKATEEMRRVLGIELAESRLLGKIAAREQQRMREKMRAQEAQFLRDCADLALDEDTGRCAEDEVWIEWTANSCPSSR